MLPEGLVVSRKRGTRLAWALGPTIVDAMRDAIHRDPRIVVDVLLPVIGPCIRQAVAAAFRGMVERLNALAEQSLSIRGLRWRVEAWRTGMPASEVALLRTLVYRVEEVFLIYRESGVVLLHVSAADVAHQDPDQVSAMLTAMDTFVRDAFRSDAHLGELQFGDLAAWIEHGPVAVIVALVRGSPPPGLRAALQRAQERTHLELGEALLAFRGNTEPFLAAEPVLRECLVAERAPPRGAISARVVICLLLALVLAIGAGSAWSRRNDRLAAGRLRAYVETLAAQPGYVVLASSRDGARYRVSGLRDPFAPDAAATLVAYGLDPGAVELSFVPFSSLDPRLLATRAAVVLRPPPGVEVSVHGSTVRVTGTASRRWIASAEGRLLGAAPFSELDEKDLREAEALEELPIAAASLRSFAIGFAGDLADVSAEEAKRLDDVAAALRALQGLAAAARMTLRIDIVGHTGGEALAKKGGPRLASERAERVAAFLRDRVAPPDLLVPRPERDDEKIRSTGCWSSAVCNPRSVTFHADFAEVAP